MHGGQKPNRGILRKVLSLGRKAFPIRVTPCIGQEPTSSLAILRTSLSVGCVQPYKSDAAWWAEVHLSDSQYGFLFAVDPSNSGECF